MIPYPELASALERWRARNGLPTSAAMPAPAARPLVPASPPAPTAAAAPAPAAPAPAPAAPAAASPAPGRSASPTTPPPAPGGRTPPAPPGRSTMYGVPPPPAATVAAAAAAARPPTNLPEEDADVIDEQHDVVEDAYDNEGQDFAMTFGGPPKSASGSIGGAGDEDTGTAQLEALEDPFSGQTAAVSAGAWPEVEAAREWPQEQTNATAYGWGSQHLRPSQPEIVSEEDDDSTVVGKK